MTTDFSAGWVAQALSALADDDERAAIRGVCAVDAADGGGRLMLAARDAAAAAKRTSLRLEDLCIALTKHLGDAPIMTALRALSVAWAESAVEFRRIEREACSLQTHTLSGWSDDRRPARPISPAWTIVHNAMIAAGVHYAADPHWTIALRNAVCARTSAKEVQ